MCRGLAVISLREFIFLMLFIVCCACLAHAEPPREDTFGPEWTFSAANGDALPTNAIYRMDTALSEHLIANQPFAERFSVKDSTYYSPEKWWFHFKHDCGSLEFTMNPMTVAEWKRHSSNINDAVFVTAANQQYYPALFRGGGHINVGVQKMSPLLIRNFIMDLLNHNELSMGVWGYNTTAATPFQVAHNNVGIDRIIQIFRDYDSGKLNMELAQDRNFFSDFSRMPRNDFELFIFRFSKQFSSKQTAINVLKAFGRYSPDIQRIEIRAVRPQASMSVWLRQIELIQGRLNYLRTLDKPIAYKPVVKYKPRQNPNVPPVDPQEALRAFYIYVEQSGQDWQNHRDYLWPQWLNPGSELEVFESSEWFIQKQYDRYAKVCEAYLQ